MRGARGARLGLVVAGLTLLALVLRLVAFGDSLYGDELFTLDDTSSDFAGIFDGLDRNEVNPPLFYILAWGFGQLGDALSLLRVPSLVLGTAVVPVTYALGKRLAGTGTGLLAALLVAISPFAIFYGTEARAYASATFFAAVAALALLNALDRGTRSWWWVVYGLSALAALYTHYTSIWLVAGTAVWAIWTHRSLARRVVLVLALVALAYLPWVPEVMEQSDKDLYIAAVGLSSELSAKTAFEYPARLVTGHPFRQLQDIPGSAWLVLLAAGIAVALAALVPRARRPGVSSEPVKLAYVAILALAVPVCVFGYSLVADDLYAPRNLIAALPGLAIAIAWAVTALRPPVAAAAALLIVVPVAAGTARGLERSNRRPDSDAAARYIERKARPGDPVAAGLGDVGTLQLYLDGHEVLSEEDPGVWRAADRGRTVFLVHGEVGDLALLPRFAGPLGRYELSAHEDLAGLRELGVGQYRGPVTARLDGDAIRLSTGRRIAITPGAVIGARDEAAGAGGALTVAGWALDRRSRRPADAVFVMNGRRCLAVVSPNLQRGDLAGAFGRQANASGFRLQIPVAREEEVAASPGLRLYAAAGNHATELPAP